MSSDNGNRLNRPIFSDAHRSHVKSRRHEHALRHWLSIHAVPLLLLSTLLLLPFNLLYQVPLAILTGMGIYQVIGDPRRLISNTAVRLFLVVFLLLWIPPLLALVNAVNFERAIPSTLRLLGFLFIGIAVIQHLRECDYSTLLYASILIILSLWIVDALVQFFLGHNLLGYPLPDQQITGIFHPKYRIGIVLAHLAPLYLEALRRFATHRPWLWLLVIPFCLVIFLSGSRSGWFTLLATLLLYGVYLLRCHKVRLRYVITISLITLLMGTTMVAHFPGLQQRVDKTVALSSLDAEADLAVAERVRAWQAAVNIIQENHWFGVGVRGFGSTAVERGYLATEFSHPHMFLLDVTTSAGIIGLMGYMLALSVLAWLFLVRLRGQRSDLFAPWLAVALALLPLNAHWGFYATFCSSLVWIIVIVALGMTARRLEHPNSG